MEKNSTGMMNRVWDLTYIRTPPTRLFYTQNGTNNGKTCIIIIVITITSAFPENHHHHHHLCSSQRRHYSWVLTSVTHGCPSPESFFAFWL
ncbi:hypothetical protein HKD37_06G015827 [Glycine soja]